MSLTLISFLFFCLAVAYTHPSDSHEVVEKVKQIVKVCKKEANFESDVEIRFDEHLNTDNLRCYIECTMKALGTIKEGKFDLEKLSDIASYEWKGKLDNAEKVRKIQAKCADDVMKNPSKKKCGPAYDFVVCTTKETEKLKGENVCSNQNEK